MPSAYLNAGVPRRLGDLTHSENAAAAVRACLAINNLAAESNAALRARVNELQINGERFDEFAGLPRGYLSKLIGARPIRRLGMTSFEPVLASLGLRCLLIVDEEATRRLKDRLPPRNESYVRSAAVHTNLTTRFLRKIGAKGGENSRKYLGKRLVKQLARRAANARWHPLQSA